MDINSSLGALSRLRNGVNISLESDYGSVQFLSSNSEVSHDDATWILTSAFIIFTMQSGRADYSLL